MSVTVHGLLDEWDGLTVARRKEAVKNLFDLILKDFEDHEDLIDDIVRSAAAVEQDDGFGTEGARL